MAALSHSETRHMYSWWWDSHISPKNSKWLQENLTDMDAKVKSMIKLIEEDADSFARRAEMYYKKRPELMKLVEEFYRAYRALAERYNHAMGELHHAHRTIAKAFPDHVPFELVEDSPSKVWTPDRDLRIHTPEMKFPVRALFQGDQDSQGLSESDLDTVTPQKECSDKGLRDRCLEELHDLFGDKEAASSKSVEGMVKTGPKQGESFHDEVLQLSNENQSLKDKILQETERAGIAESEVQGLKRALADGQAAKEEAFRQYQQCLVNLSNLEGELDSARRESVSLSEKSSRAEIEVQTLKEALVQLEVEKIAGEDKQQEYLEKISELKDTLSQLQEDTDGSNIRATKAEIESQMVKDEISMLEGKRNAVLHQYNQCLKKISALENVVSTMENEARLLKRKVENTEKEVSELKKSLADLNKEKDASELQYNCCLEIMSKLEEDLSSSKRDVKRLNNDILLGNLKLQNAEEKCNLLEMSNHSLRAEADNLVKKIAMKDRELLEKQQELEGLQTSLQDEHLRHTQVEETLQMLQSSHSRSQDDQRALVQELQRVLQMLKDLEVSNHGLEEENQQVRDENQSSSQTNMCSGVSAENKESEILSLRDIKERLEKEVSHHIDISNSLQHEISCLKEEIRGLNRSYWAILDQIELAGLKPECLGTSLKSLQDEKLTLKEMYELGCTEKELLLKKLESLQTILEKKVEVESSITDMSSELESSREKVRALQESCQSFHGEKATLVTEKAHLLSQLQAMTESMHKVLEKNAVLENSLSSAKVELEGLREKTKGLEDICELLKDERSYLLTERGILALKLENVERRLEVLEKKYTGLEEKYADLVKEKEAVRCHVKELEVSLGVEKQERTNSHLHSQTRLAGLESQLHVLREENKWKKKEYEEELDKSIKAQFELSVLQKIIEDMEGKNASLIIECQKHVEASKLAEKLITELESESLEQQVEAEILLDEIERMRLNLYQVSWAVGTGPDCTAKSRIDNEQIFVHRILESIQDMQLCISKHDDDKQLLLVENSVLLTLLEQLESKGMEVESKKLYLEKDLRNMAEKLAVARNEKDKLLEVNRELDVDANTKQQYAIKLEAELQSVNMKRSDLHRSFKLLEGAYLEVKQKNTNSQKQFSELREEKYQANQQIDTVLLEYLATAVQSEAVRSFGDEKLSELNSLLSDLNTQHEINHCLERQVRMLSEKLELQKNENVLLMGTVDRLEREMEGVREYNVQMKKDILTGKESLLQTEGKLLVAEIKLEAADNLNLKLCKTVNDLKDEIQESLKVKENLENDLQQLSGKNSIQMKEIERLHEVNGNLESEIGLLREELEEEMIREQTLSSELRNKNHEFELWEAEAAAFYFGLQITSVNEVLFRSKVQELTGLCCTLQNENASKTSEIEETKGKICLMESEISRLKSHLHAYVPVVAALRDDIIFLEHNALIQTKIKASHKEAPEMSEVATGPDRSTSDIILQDQSLVSLQNLQMRVKAVGKSMQVMNKTVVHRRTNSSTKQEPTAGEIERLKPLRCLGRDKQEHSRRKGQGNELSDTPKLQKIKTKSAELRSAVQTKDIPLDQASDSSQHGLRRRGSVRVDDKMLELWQSSPDGGRDLTIGESLRLSSYRMTDKDIVYDQFRNGNRKSEPPSTDSDVEKELGVDKLEVLTRSASRSREVSARRILERLSSDAQKLENLQIMVEDLRKKLEGNKKGRKVKNVDFETVEEQLLEAEETVVHLVDLNGQLVKTIEDCPSPDEKASVQLKETAKKRRRKATEQARKGSERIGRLQLEVQKIQYMLLKLEDEKKNRLKNKLFRSKTIVLRDFIYNGRKNSGKRKKGPFCGCFRPSTSRNGVSQSQ